MSSQLKANSRNEGYQDDDKNKQQNEKIDPKVPFDMKTFWKNINEKFFRKLDQFSINEVNHLSHLYSKYDVHHDQIFSKIGFPRTTNCLVGKSQEIMSRKNNPQNVTKFFGMYVHIDKFDYLVNNLNNEDIEEEIDFISEKLSQTEENNLFFFKNLENVIKSLPVKIDLDSEKVFLDRCDNLTGQIFALQMKQFAESIWNIKKDLKKNKYLLIFDQSEMIDNLSLEEKEYKDLLKFRDPMNSVSVYDLFQEKIFSYFNTGSQNQSPDNKNVLDSKIEKKRRGRRPKKNMKDVENLNIVKNGKIGKLHKLGKINKNKTSNKKEQIEIAKHVAINFDFCHHCKQRKPAEVMMRCQSSHCHKYLERPLKTFYVNNTTCVRKFKNFVITNFVGDPKDILAGYLNKKVAQNCSRSFCNFCLKGSYDQIIDQIKDKKDWICPWCQGLCFCSRCIRYDQILKLISLYISHNGDINILYDNLINKSIVLDKLSQNLLISNIIIINNDTINKSIKSSIKSYTGKSDYEAIDNVIDQCYKYKNKVTNLKEYFDKSFNKARHEKAILNIDKKLTQVCLRSSVEKGSHIMLNKKKKRSDYEDEINEFGYDHFKQKLGNSHHDLEYDDEECTKDDSTGISQDFTTKMKKLNYKNIVMNHPVKINKIQNNVKKVKLYKRLAQSLV